MTLLKTICLRKMKLTRHLENIFIFNQKRFAGKILINNEDIKVLLTEGTKVKTDIENYLTMKIST